MYMHALSTHPTAGVPASIALPPELFNQVPTDRLFIGVYFTLYENTALFPTNMSAVVRNNVTRSVGTPIVAATVGPGIDFGGDVPLDPPVVITLGLLPLPENTSVRTQYTPLKICRFVQLFSQFFY